MNISLGEIWRKLKIRYGSQETVHRTLRKMGMRIGKGTRFYTVRIPGEPWLVRIGEACLVSNDVTFVTHNANTVFQHKYETLTGFGTIEMKDNSYIGVNATIMPNVTIGPNAVVGACSVVTKDVPPETVVAGNPARVVCSLKEYEQKCVEQHLDVPEDRAELRVFLEQHFWDED